VVRDLPAPVQLLLAGGALCNDAHLREEQPAEHYHASGDPTEAALLLAAAHAGLWQRALVAAFPRVGEAPFDSERKRMSTVHAPVHGVDGIPGALRALAGDGRVVSVKGAAGSSARRTCGRAQAPSLTAEWRARILEANARLAGDGMRVLGVALRRMPGEATDWRADTLERELVFVGLFGIIDPPRAEVKAAIETCRVAGIRPVMITGDHPLTARRIAQDLGITGGGRVLTGQESA
jgi:Ca2+-transporting ATPase